jgi:hypothetical protein
VQAQSVLRKQIFSPRRIVEEISNALHCCFNGSQKAITERLTNPSPSPRPQSSFVGQTTIYLIQYSLLLK